MPERYPVVVRRGAGWAVQTGPKEYLSRTFFRSADAMDALNVYKREQAIPVGATVQPQDPYSGLPSLMEGAGQVALPATAPAGPTGIGEVPELNPDDFYWKWSDADGAMIPARKGEPGATFSNTWWAQANESRRDVATGGAGTGRTGPTAAELAIQRSQVQATNLATFISGTIAELELEIDAKRLTTEQALGEFNKRLDAFTTSGELFEGIQPYTIPIGAEYVPGFQPGGIGEQLGIAPRKAEVIQYDPFAMANQIVSESQVLTDIGVPSGDELSRAVEMARGFLGG